MVTNQQELNKKLVKELAECRTKLVRCKNDFEVEKSIKNGLYFFILENGLFEELKTFEPKAKYQTTDYKIKSLEKLANDLP
ncbi:hypothetical protein [Kordia jejudonensis]|uniref:hypothetical protein n=1 Tax=Kordia jejudonensis TaxID=1348245 RepID=UPI0006295F84|nr:hypothetical protein [Kordia jejudonensis]